MGHRQTAPRATIGARHLCWAPLPVALIRQRVSHGHARQKQHDAPFSSTNATHNDLRTPVIRVLAFKAEGREPSTRRFKVFHFARSSCYKTDPYNSNAQLGFVVSSKVVHQFEDTPLWVANLQHPLLPRLRIWVPILGRRVDRPRTHAGRKRSDHSSESSSQVRVMTMLLALRGTLERPKQGGG